MLCVIDSQTLNTEFIKLHIFDDLKESTDLKFFQYLLIFVVVF
jgi:hypothetical protein